MVGGKWLLAALVPFAFTACGGGDDPALTLELAQENSSRQSGTATLTPADDGSTTIVIELSNPPDAPQPAHVHPGPCGDLGDPIAGLQNLVGGRSESTVSMSLDDLRTGDLVVHAHKSEAEFEISVACALIPAR
jgi:hypothetical protein